MALIDEFLGLGYTGYVRINGTYLLLLASAVSEEESLLKSDGLLSTNLDRTVGQAPVRNRRKLRISISAHLTPAATLLAADMITWRNNGGLGTYDTYLYVANGEGYHASEAFVESFDIAAPNAQLCTVKMNLLAWYWDALGSTGPNLSTRAFELANNPDHQPIPQWATSITNPAVTGNCMDFAFSVNQGWAFTQLCEKTSIPPLPMPVLGPLSIKLNQTILAKHNARPEESATGVIVNLGKGLYVGGLDGSRPVPDLKIYIPQMYRDPSRSYQGVGNPNNPITWQVEYSAIGLTPYLI